MSVSNQKILLLMLAQAQPPLVFKATGGIATGVHPMISVRKYEVLDVVNNNSIFLVRVV